MKAACPRRLQAKMAGPAEATRGRKEPPQEIQRQHNPVNTLISGTGLRTVAGAALICGHFTTRHVGEEGAGGARPAAVSG